MLGLLILGAGGHGKVVGEAAAETGRWERIAFLDNRYPLYGRILDWDVIGRVDDMETFSGGDAVVAIGSNTARTRLLRDLAARGFATPNVVHPRAYVSPSAELGAGTVVLAQAAINAQAKLGLGCIVNTGATVDHDCLLGEGVHISPGAHIAGEARIGRHSWIGIGASVIQQIAIGDSAIVGAGAVVVRDVADDVTVVGTPAKNVQYRLRCER